MLGALLQVDMWRKLAVRLALDRVSRGMVGRLTTRDSPGARGLCGMHLRSRHPSGLHPTFP